VTIVKIIHLTKDEVRRLAARQIRDENEMALQIMLMEQSDAQKASSSSSHNIQGNADSFIYTKHMQSLPGI
jgi:hypothetical protein